MQLKSLEEAERHIESLSDRMRTLEQIVSDQQQRFDTLQTPWWKRWWFKLDGWPGQRDLNALKPQWRPWRRWYTS